MMLISIRKGYCTAELPSRRLGRVPSQAPVRLCELSMVSAFSKNCNADDSVELALNWKFRHWPLLNWFSAFCVCYIQCCLVSLFWYLQLQALCTKWKISSRVVQWDAVLLNSPQISSGSDFCSWLVLYRMYSAVDHFLSLYLWLEVADLSWWVLVTWPHISQSHCLVQCPLLPAFWGSQQWAVPVKGLLQEVMVVLGKSQPVHSGIDNQSHSLTEAHQPYDGADCFPLAEQEGINLPELPSLTCGSANPSFTSGCSTLYEAECCSVEASNLSQVQVTSQ